MIDHGPSLPPPAVLHQRAKEIQALAARAADYARSGPRQDIGAVMRAMQAIGELAGVER